MQSHGTWWLWALFTVIVLTILIIDLFYIGYKKRPPGLKESLIWTSIWIGVALCFNVLIWWYFAQILPIAAANQKAFEFFTAYLIEESLSLDNLFVFLMIFKYFSIPLIAQRRLLFYGVFGAVVFRFILILSGMWLINKFDWILYVFGFLLLYSAKKIIFLKDNPHDITDNFMARILRRILPIGKELIHDKFFYKIKNKWHMSPLFVVLIFIEGSDLIFAIDSIPAVFGITNDPFIAFTSNTFAILGLRSLYFVLANIQTRFHYLNIGLAIILAFIGIKMLLHSFIEIPILLTLLFVIIVLTTSIVASKYIKKKT